MENIKEYIYLYKKYILIIVIFIIFILLCGGIYYLSINKKQVIKKEIVYIEKEETKKETYKVEIKGSVKNPGVYELDINKRVIDLINASGGLLEDADTSIINLSKKIFDEMLVVIYSREEVENYSKIKEEENTIINNINESVIKNDGLIDEVIIDIDKKININTATKEQLMTLPGIGESKANSIIEYRSNTLFDNIEDILNVSGIGDSLYEQIKDFIET